MAVLKVYVDTSIFGAVFDVEDPIRVDITRSLLKMLKGRERYIPYISNIVTEEVEKAPIEIRDKLSKIVLDTPSEMLTERKVCVELVEEYLRKKIIPKKSRDDARHVAVAVINNMDVIITWNCRHMANIEKKRKINATNMMLGYKQIDIVTPLEVIEYG
jgi:predicted nucleic acid-binding protein